MDSKTFHFLMGFGMLLLGLTVSVMSQFVARKVLHTGDVGAFVFGFSCSLIPLMLAVGELFAAVRMQ